MTSFDTYLFIISAGFSVIPTGIFRRLPQQLGKISALSCTNLWQTFLKSFLIRRLLLYRWHILRYPTNQQSY